MTRKVSCQYSDGCPNWRTTADHLARLADEGLDVTVDHESIDSHETAVARGFHGSPTVLVDGVDGIPDWRAAGLPIEGDTKPAPRAIDAARNDLPTCRPGETLATVRPRVIDGGWDICVVLDCGDMAIGRIRGSGFDADSGRQVADVMEPGPSTVRADTPLQPLIERLRKHNAPNVIVTTHKEDFSGFSFVTKPPGCSPEKHRSDSGATANAAPDAGPTRVLPPLTEQWTAVPEDG